METVFSERARWFLVDNQRGKRLEVRVGEQTFGLPESRKDGHFQEVIQISKETVAPLADNDWLRFEAVTRKDDRRTSTYSAGCVDAEGDLSRDAFSIGSSWPAS